MTIAIIPAVIEFKTTVRAELTRTFPKIKVTSNWLPFARIGYNFVACLLPSSIFRRNSLVSSEKRPIVRPENNADKLSNNTANAKSIKILTLNLNLTTVECTNPVLYAKYYWYDD